MGDLVTDYATGSFSEIETIRSQDDLDAGLPLQGEHIWGGVHVLMTTDPQSPGWTRHVFPTTKHPLREEYAYPVVDSLERRAELIASLPPQAAARVAAAKPLSADWDPPGLADKSVEVEVTRAP